MVKKERITVLAAAGCGLAATVIAWAFLESQATEQEQITYRSILVASVDLSPNSVIEDGDLREVDIPDTPDFALFYSIAMKPEERPTVVNRRVARALPAGAPITYADLMQFEELKISPGMIALSIQASGANGLGGLLVPGDIVHLVVTSPKSGDPEASSMMSGSPDQVSSALLASMFGAGNEFESETVANDVRVIAIGTSLNRARAGFLLGDAGYDPTRDLSSVVTLEVTLPMAESILERSGAGRFPITLLLAETKRETGSP